MKYIVKTSILFGIITVMSVLSSSCGRDMFDDQNTAVIKNVLEDVCTEWGVDEADVSAAMGKYDLADMADDFMKYYDSDSECMISYLFDENGLCASSVIIDAGSEISTEKLFSKYEYVGRLNGEEIYCMKQKNIFLTTYTVIKDDNTKLIIGMTKFQ